MIFAKILLSQRRQECVKRIARQSDADSQRMDRDAAKLICPTDRADDVQVLIGNSYLQAGKNDKAAEAYDKAIRTYPGGDAIPEAYYKKGLALRNLRQPELARQAFEYAAKTYPDSAAGQLAKQQLTQLGAPAAR